jgi:hypothetical protein
MSRATGTFGWDQRGSFATAWVTGREQPLEAAVTDALAIAAEISADGQMDSTLGV